MYWRTYSPVTDDELRSFKDFPEDWISKDIYEGEYKDNDNRIRRYLFISKLYEYLAFTFKLRDLELTDMLGDHWLEMWTLSLMSQDEFLNVHKSYSGYYPDFEKYVDKLIGKNN